MHYTPGNVSVSSKHVLSHFDDGNRVIFAITPAVKGTCSPAVSGGAVTQGPVSVRFNNRLQELRQVTFVRWTLTKYSRRSEHAYNRNTYIFLDVLLCSIAEYFYELCRILASS